MSASSSGTFCLMGGSTAQDGDAEVLLRDLAANASGDGSAYLVHEPAGGSSLRNIAAYFESAMYLPVHRQVRTHLRADAGSTIDASVIYICGGNPSDYVRRLQDSGEWLAITEAVGRGAALAGSSAGAECLGVVARDLEGARSGGTYEWLPGLGLFPQAFVGTHWNNVADGSDDGHAFRRAFNAALVDSVGERLDVIAVDEQTAAIGDGLAWTVRGRGSVHVRGHGLWRQFQPGDHFTIPLRPCRG